MPVALRRRALCGCAPPRIPAGRRARGRSGMAGRDLGVDLVAIVGGLSRDWGSCRDGCWRMRIVGGLEALPETGAGAARVDGAAALEEEGGPAPGPGQPLRLGHAPVDQEIGRALGQ